MRRVKFLLFLLPAIILLLVLPRPVLADMVNLEPTADSFINDNDDPPPLDYINKNYGSAHSLITSDEPVVRASLLKFDLFSIPADVTIDSAILRLYLYGTDQTTSTTLTCRRLTGDWEENGVTWNNQPGDNTDSQAQSTITTGTDWKEWNVTDMVRNWYSGDWTNYGLKITTEGAAKSHSFRSKEYSSNHPELVINYSSAPGTTPTPTPSPSPSPSLEETPSPTPTEEPSPTPEESPSPTPEAEEGKAGILGLSTGQAVIGGLILLSLIGAGIAFAAYSRRKPAKKPKKKQKEKPEEKPEPESKEKEEEVD